MLSVFVARAGLIVSGVGLWLLSISAVSFVQGLQDLSSWRSFVLGLVLIFAGNYIYKKGEEDKTHQQTPGRPALWSKRAHHRPVVT
jgi:putative flippase GtrA